MVLKRFHSDGSKKFRKIPYCWNYKSSTVIILKRFLNDGPKVLKGSKRCLNQVSKNTQSS